MVFIFDEYVILEGTKEICDNAFFDLWNETDFLYLDKVTIPASVVSIGQCPFNKYLSQIICLSPHFEVENNTLYSKGKNRLIQCFAKTDVFIIPKEVRRIDNFAFCGCKSRHIIIGQNVDSIGINPFVEMDLDGNKLILESVSPKYEIANSCLCENGHKLIAYLGNDEVFRVPNNIDEIADLAFCSSSLKIIHLPESIKGIADSAFRECSCLKYVSAPTDIAIKHSKIGAIYSYLLMLEDDGGMSEVEMEIIQAVYRQLPLDEIVDSLGIGFDELEEKLEELVKNGWELDINYFLNDVMDNENIKTIYEYIENHKDYSLWLLTKKLSDDFTEDEVRLVWIKYLSEKHSSMETDYNERHQSIVNDLYNDDLSFFLQKHIHTQYGILTPKLKHELSKWQLTKFEMLMLLCYQGDLSEVFDKGNSKSSPFPINEMCQGLDTVLMKAPSCSEVPVVYRQHKSNNVLDFKKGETRTFESYLTASTNNWNQPRHQLIITLNKDNTKAKSLYKMRNDKGEFQVTFKRGTTFYIENVEAFYDDGEKYRRIWMKEL